MNNSISSLKGSADYSSAATEATQEGMLIGHKITLLKSGCMVFAGIGMILTLGGVSLFSCAWLLVALYAIPVLATTLGGLALVSIGVKCLMFAKNLEHEANGLANVKEKPSIESSCSAPKEKVESFPIASAPFWHACPPSTPPPVSRDANEEETEPPPYGSV